MSEWCRTCGAAMRHLGRRQSGRNGHHRHVYRCPNPHCSVGEVERG